MLKIPHRDLSAQALQHLMEEYISREGTDYGQRELDMQDKVALLQKQLHSGAISIVFDAVSESCTIVTEDQWQQLLLVNEKVESEVENGIEDTDSGY